MTVEACKSFLRATRQQPELGQQLKAVTGMEEMIALGGRHGFDFTAQELAAGSAELGAETTPEPAADEPAPPRGTAFYHHEYDLADVPELAPLIDELPLLKVRPPVDLAAFRARFRADDLESTSKSPSDPEFQEWNRRMMAAHWQDPAGGGARRDFHLVNLDEHVEHPGYPAYFAAKTRAIRLLEGVFGDEIRLSGSMWYPPNSYRLWHTNENQPGWRMYVVDLDDDFPEGGGTSFFRYQNPGTGEIVTLPERRRIVRFFKAEQDPAKLFWHCIVNPTERHRWSFGFVVPDGWQDHLRSLSAA
uniref:KyaX n=1 Tax=Saccharopolyspora sp. TaxID=33915 RepID=A0A4Y6I1J5_9PSEU|nr:KyaX [Saccharopolyspora sp.]QDF63349.1 KyaX [Saccharopolyspora sp.]